MSDPMSDPFPNDVVMVFVPDRHPLAGRRVVIPAASGATTYNDGEIHFASPLSLALDETRAALSDLAEKMAEVTRDRS